MLFEDFDAALKINGLDFFKNKVADYIIKNLNPSFAIREYQKEAIGRFDFYIKDFPQKKSPAHLLFNMATGSGKTLIMAANILYLYQQGYRNFIFFVNSTNIIEKTRDNFLNPLSSKYLFAEKIKFGDKEIKIKEVENFEAANQEDISIVFTTIQGLHISLNNPKENTITFVDFKEEKIVMISDEAHHINALTRNRLTRTEEMEKKSWEGTVETIFRSNYKNENIMLEFTATIDLNNPEIKNKYEDKIIYQYDLKHFREDKFSKEIKVLRADLEPIDRALQAVILSQYRKIIAENNGLLIKPVILMKSQTIEESKRVYEEFVNLIKNLRTRDLRKIMEIAKRSSEDQILRKAFEHFAENNIPLDNLVKMMKEEFSEERCLSVNSKEDSEEKQITINTLEDKNNGIRVIFAVDMLNEGWDVLNLFDIVRLYETRDAKAGKPGRTTMAEAQLIGRGARYFPFLMNPDQEKYKRKYDDDLTNELKILEELYYHSFNNPRYIDELRTALIKTGIMEERAVTINHKVKENFKASEFWKTGLIYLNEKKSSDRSKVKGLYDIIRISENHRFHIRTGQIGSNAIFENERIEVIEESEKDYLLIEFGSNVIRTALSRIEFFRFDNLKKYFPNLSSITEFINSEKYLGKIKVSILGYQESIEHLSAEQKLEASIKVLLEVAQVILIGATEYIGTDVFSPIGIQNKVKDKESKIVINEGTDQQYGISMRETSNTALHLDLSREDWYVYEDNYGTSEEKYLIKFIKSYIEKLKKKYKDIYLLRNEGLFQVYRFSDGQAIEPDFVLFAKEIKSGKQINYQLFIESKGEPYIEKDKWKEEFLKEIEGKYKIEVMFRNKEIRLVGLPFYNERLKKEEFKKEFESIL